MPDDDRALMERLAALEAEVKADADAQRARKEAALAKVREERARQQTERADLRDRQAAPIPRKREPEVDHTDGLAGALELANKAGKYKAELTKKPAKGEKSWIKSGLASAALGPVGWLYAGSWREAVPATAVWLVAAYLLSFLPTILLLPILLVAMPLSGIAGAVYALGYNRTGKRQRLFGDSAKKQLPDKTER